MSLALNTIPLDNTHEPTNKKVVLMMRVSPLPENSFALQSPQIQQDAFFEKNNNSIIKDSYVLQPREPVTSGFGMPSVFQAYLKNAATQNLPRLDIVTRPPEPKRVKKVQLRVDLNVVPKKQWPDIEEFIAVIFDADFYPLDAKYLDGDVLIDSYNLGEAQGYELIYERTAVPAGGQARQFVMAMCVSEQTDKRVKIDWNVLKEDYAKDYFADVFNEDPDALYTPYNHGSWILDLNYPPSITYQFDVDPGGRVPLWLIPDDLLLTFPKKLLADNWGIEL